MDYLAAAALGGLVVLLAGAWGWCAADLRATPPRGVPGKMRLVVDNTTRRARPVRRTPRQQPPASAAQQALNRLEAVVAAHHAATKAARTPGADQGAIRSPRQS